MSRRRTWTERTCVGCGAVYEFDTIEVAKASPVLRWVGLEGEPGCPECGCVPPANAIGRKVTFHIAPTLAGVALGGFIGLIGGVTADSVTATAISYSTAGIALGVVAVVVWVLHAAIAFADPNRHRDRNVRRSDRLENIGLMEVVSGPDPDLSDGVPRSMSAWAYPLLAFGAVGVLVCFSPTVLKGVSGWPENPHTSPELVGPGDTLRVWLPQPVQAVNGKWNGTSQAELLVEGQTQPTVIPATASNDTWGNSISGKTVSNTRTNLWSDVKLPDDPALVGKRVEVRVDVTYRYPHDVGGWFEEVDGEGSTAQVYTLADRGAKRRYVQSFFLAGLGCALVALCGVGLSVAAHRQAAAAGQR